MCHDDRFSPWRPPERLFRRERGCQRPGQPGGCFLQELEEHVECRVDIAVCVESAPRALETLVPSQFVVQRAALAARLRRTLFRDHEHVLLTLKRVGLFLDKDVFAHGQVYVGMSRCGGHDNVSVYGTLNDKGELWVRNPVYKEVLTDKA